MEFENRESELSSYWKYKEMKNFYKLINKSQNRYIPPEIRKKVFQTISDLMIHYLPDDVNILELFPNTEFGYSKKGELTKKNWTFEEVNEYMDNLVMSKNQNFPEKSLKRNRFFMRELDKTYKKDEKEELRAYNRLLKACRQGCFAKETKEIFYDTIQCILKDRLGSEEEKD